MQVRWQSFGALAKVALIVLALRAISKPAQAFDTGHHFDLTREAMRDQGFGNTAIEADFYAKLTVAGQTFTEAMQLDRSSITPAWTTIKFVSNSLNQVPILYQLWDEDGVGRGDDDHVDINPKKGVRDLNFSFAMNNHSLSGDITGVHDNSETPVNIAGAKSDSNRGVLQFYVTERPLKPAQ